MNIEEKKKVHLNYLSIIVGTKCNLKCAHCLGGNPDAMTIQPEYIDAMLNNLTGINELQIIGYEPTLYIDTIKMIFEKIIARKLKVNYLTFYTNCAVFSKEYAEIFNDFRLNHTTFPKEALFQTSFDEFHYNNGFTKEKYEENLRKYKSEIKDCDFISHDLSGGIIIVGRAKHLSNMELQEFDKVSVIEHGRFPVEFRPECKGVENTCNNGNCICNCIVTPIVLLPNGYVYNWDAEAFYALAENDFSYATGHIESECLFEMIKSHFNSNYNNIIVYQELDSYLWNGRFLLNRYLEFRESALNSFKENSIKLYKAAEKMFIQNIRLTNKRIQKANGTIDDIKYFWKIFAEIKAELSQFEKMKNIYFLSSIDKENMYKQIEKHLIKFSKFAPHNIKSNFGYDYQQFRDMWSYYDDANFDKYYDKIKQIINEV